MSVENEKKGFLTKGQGSQRLSIRAFVSSVGGGNSCRIPSEEKYCPAMGSPCSASGCQLKFGWAPHEEHYNFPNRWECLIEPAQAYNMTAGPAPTMYASCMNSDMGFFRCQNNLIFECYTKDICAGCVKVEKPNSQGTIIKSMQCRKGGFGGPSVFSVYTSPLGDYRDCLDIGE